MNRLSPEQLNTLGKGALVVIVSALQDQLELLSAQLDSAKKQLVENNHRIDLLTEQIRIMNQRQFGRRSESSLQSGGSAAPEYPPGKWQILIYLGQKTILNLQNASA